MCTVRKWWNCDQIQLWQWSSSGDVLGLFQDPKVRLAKCGEGEECGRTWLACSWWKPGHAGPWEKFRFSSKYNGKPAAGLEEECEVWDLSGYETGRKGSRGKQSSWDSLVTKQRRDKDRDFVSSNSGLFHAACKCTPSRRLLMAKPLQASVPLISSMFCSQRTHPLPARSNRQLSRWYHPTSFCRTTLEDKIWDWGYVASFSIQVFWVWFFSFFLEVTCYSSFLKIKV